MYLLYFALKNVLITLFLMNTKSKEKGENSEKFCKSIVYYNMREDCV